MNDLLKHAEKMANPAVILQSVMNLTVVEWASVYKTAGLLAKKLSEKVMPINVIFLDLMDNKRECPGNNGGEHELVPSEKIDPEIKPECYMCAHCLEKFKKATNLKKTFCSEG